jgi:DNA-binding response OmpR family regulator
VKVLVVEDQEDACRALVRFLKRLGHEATGVHTLAEAMGVLSTVPDTILLDLHLPDGWGTEVLGTVRRLGLPCRVAVVTATTNPDVIERVHGLEPDGFFEKPLDLREFADWLGGPPPRAA